MCAVRNVVLLATASLRQHTQVLVSQKQIVHANRVRANRVRARLTFLSPEPMCLQEGDHRADTKPAGEAFQARLQKQLVPSLADPCS